MNNMNKRILFLAKYAPQNNKSKIPIGIEDVVYAEYHHDIYRILSSTFNSVDSYSDISQLLSQMPDTDFVFSLYNRMNFRNSEVFVSSVCEYYGLPYLGATPNLRAVAEDKHLAKIFVSHLGIATSNWCICDVGKELPPIVFDGPYFVKPRYGASSLNIDESSYCVDIKAVSEKTKNYHDSGIDVIIEKYIPGTSITVPVINNFGNPIVLPSVIESSSTTHNIITYKQKRMITTGLNRTINTDNELQEKIKIIALKLFQSIQPMDYTRIDFIIEEISGIPHFVELNVCCNLGKHAAINISANSIGIDHDELIKNITFSSMYRQHLIDIPINNF